LRPAEVGAGLVEILLERQYAIEDAQYQKVVPNQFVVELQGENYYRHYQPIESQIIQQWHEKLLRHLVTTNSRLGRKEYRFGGVVRVEIHPVGDLTPAQARVRARVETNLPEAGPRAAYGFLELIQPSGSNFPLSEGDNVLGRGTGCSLRLDTPELRATRLISSKHATLRCREGRCLLLDGSPDGKASLNGTFVNGAAVPPVGWELMDGDLIILAAIDPGDPRPDTPGVASLRYHTGSVQESG
jgi:hypothetical protein